MSNVQLFAKYMSHHTSRLHGVEEIDTLITPENRTAYHGCDPLRLASLSWAVPEAAGAAAKNWVNQMSNVQLPA